MTTIDTQWFTDRLTQRQLSQRGLAKLMGLDPAAISLMFRGKRRMTLAEAAQLAVLLDVSTTEMLERAGLPIHAQDRVKLAGYMLSNGEVAMAGEGAHEFVDAPGPVADSVIAFQARTSGTDREMIDGWIHYVDDVKGSPATCLGQYGMAAIKGNGIKIAFIKKGYRRGTYNLMIGATIVAENAELAWASPVIWIKTNP